jgi:hypothetical protein
VTISPAAPSDATFHAVQRRIAALLPAHAEPASGGGAVLDFAGVSTEPPRLIAAQLLEGRTLLARRVDGAPEARFAAFLDGTQTSRVVAHLEGVPIVHGTTAAVIRSRTERRLRTWVPPRLERRLYAPLALLGAADRAAIESSGIRVVDTLADRQAESLHPFALQDAAVHAVQADREALERELAEEWCSRAEGDLLLDGSISGSDVVATA